jgi:hypothetical protein
VTAARPLCYGQLSVWRFIEGLPRHRQGEANVGRLLTLPTGLTVEATLAALDALWRRHEALRTTFEVDEYGRPAQLVHPAPESVVEVTDLDGDGSAAARLVEETAAAPFSLRDDFGWRAQVMTVDGMPVFLGLAIHHIVTDGWALEHIQSELEGLLHGADDEPARDAGGPVALAVEQRSDAWAKRRAAAHAYWRELAEEFGDGAETRPAESRSGRRIRVTLDLGPVSAVVGEVARRYRISPQSVVFALLAIGMAALRQSVRCLIPVMSANRFRPPWNTLVTSMNQQIPVGLAVDPGEPFSSFAGRVYRAGMKAFRNGSYDVDDLLDLTSRIVDYRNLDCLFNYRAAGWPEPAPVDLADVPPPDIAVAESSRVAIAKLYVIVSGRETLSIAAHADPLAYPEESVKRLMRGTEAALRTLAAAPDVPVGELAGAVHNT